MDKNIQNKLLEARKLLEQYAPKGEFLAFINEEEANLLKQFGGSGRITESGIPSFDTTNTQQNINTCSIYSSCRTKCFRHCNFISRSTY